MAGSFNRITIVGNVGRGPEERMLPSGNQVTEFSVATTERRKDGAVTTWLRTLKRRASTCARAATSTSRARSPGAHTPVATASSGSRWR